MRRKVCPLNEKQVGIDTSAGKLRPEQRGGLQIDAERLEVFAAFVDLCLDTLGSFLVASDAQEASCRSEPPFLILLLAFAIRVHGLLVRVLDAPFEPSQILLAALARDERVSVELVVVDVVGYVVGFGHALRSEIGRRRPREARVRC